MPDRIDLTDARALRAYAHPTRMELVGLLRRHGSLTATRAAELTGESVAGCSYHLRMLAKYGLVEQSGGGRGREKPWRATARTTHWEAAYDDPAATEAVGDLTMAQVEAYVRKLGAAIAVRHRLPRAWQAAEHSGDWSLYLTPGELTRLTEDTARLLSRYDDRFADPARRPEGARLVSVLRLAFVDPTDPTDPGEAGDPAAEPPQRPS
ncbi:helix-turn-helix domain-containing protein [Streptomyces sp. WMMC500]|uniref:helix-turn-helix domain-containing protein n=1 Tax=Streptomyces sp. WMMC500 TaxID=3015154 RepID=UPI00248BF0F9|nr:helix-turn-helix domain-containing protein [Streptomyces sp. WMMC500]WBB60269.1 helix-turn-helix domain-containing protein [Streptomyces sp. WMMC500]